MRWVATSSTHESQKDKRTSMSVGSRYTDIHTMCIFSPRLKLWFEPKEHQIDPWSEKSSKRSEFFGFYLYICHVIRRFCYTSFCSTKFGENPRWQSSEHLPVAQKLTKASTRSAAEIRVLWYYTNVWMAVVRTMQLQNLFYVKMNSPHVPIVVQQWSDLIW